MTANRTQNDDHDDDLLMKWHFYLSGIFFFLSILNGMYEWKMKTYDDVYLYLCIYEVNDENFQCINKAINYKTYNFKE